MNIHECISKTEMYFVAFCDNWCSTVPKSWIDKSEQVIKWPPKSENATTACKKGTNPKTNWQHVKYTRLLGPYNNYEVARQVEIAAVDLSTSDEASFINITKKKEVARKRPRKPPARNYYEESSDDDSHDDNETDSKDDESNGNKKVPANTFNYKSMESGQDDDLADTQPLEYGDFFEDPAYDNSEEKEERCEKLAVRKVEIIKKPIHVIEITSKTMKFPDHLQSTNIVMKDNGNNHNNDDLINNNNSADKITKQGSTSDPDYVPKKTISNKNDREDTAEMNLPITNPAEKNDNINNQLVAPVCQNCCPGCRSKLEQMSRKLDMVLMYVKISNNNSPPTSSTNLLNALPEFTIKNDNSLEELNKILLENEEARAQYANIVRLRKVPDGKKHIRDVLAFILDDKFSLKLSWSGQKRTTSVKEMTFIKLLTSTIINSNPQSTLVDLNGAIKSWLQHASDRVKYTTQKHKAKN